MAIFHSFAVSASPSLLADVNEVLGRAETSTLAAQRSGDHWNYPLYMGPNFVAQYYLMRFWFRQDANFPAQTLVPLDEGRLRQDILKAQLEDGSWQTTRDPSVQSGNLDATIMNYWALKVMGLDPSSAELKRAREFILRNGGVEKASAFSRIFLALFNQLSWSSVPWTPLFLANPNNPSFLNVDQFPQWIRPHIVPIIYLRSMRVRRDLGSRFSIAELHTQKDDLPDSEPLNTDRSGVRQIVDRLLQTQHTLGSWGGYTISTMLSAAVLDDYLLSKENIPDRARLQSAALHGLQFVDMLYLNPESSSAYKGTACDGRYWDTILVLQGLLSRDRDYPGAAPVVRYLQSVQTPNGGIPFGVDFESTPDIDDTAELITTLSLLPITTQRPSIEHATQWLDSMQNSDGGWGAFDHDNNGNFVLRVLSRGLADSATMFDPSTPDVTGHALEALGAIGRNMQNSAEVRHAIEYLRSTTSKEGLWEGRWGVNYIYGTNAVLSGLIRVGVPVKDKMIRKALLWLLVHQNPDGGFGETTGSYLDANLAGQGVSTPSQTAWALMSLVRAGLANSPTAERAVRYLLNTASPDGRWQDRSVVGTGHSGLLYLAYPSYPVAFPMIALSEYVHSFADSTKPTTP